MHAQQMRIKLATLGIQVGDFVAFDPRVEMLNGFIRSRHLDDKACVACICTAIKGIHALERNQPKRPLSTSAITRKLVTERLLGFQKI